MKTKHKYVEPDGFFPKSVREKVFGTGNPEKKTTTEKKATPKKTAKKK